MTVVRYFEIIDHLLVTDNDIEKIIVNYANLKATKIFIFFNK